jgi:Spy/CpxP family protein refolding chaperone
MNVAHPSMNRPWSRSRATVASGRRALLQIASAAVAVVRRATVPRSASVALVCRATLLRVASVGLVRRATLLRVASAAAVALIGPMGVEGAGAQEPPRTPVVTTPGISTLRNLDVVRQSRDPLADAFFSPELVMRHQQAIGLTSEQRSAIVAAISAAQPRFIEAQWQLEPETAALNELVRGSRVDEQGLLAQVDRVLEIERQIKRIQVEMLVRIKNELSQEQQEQLARLGGRRLMGYLDGTGHSNTVTWGASGASFLPGGTSGLFRYESPVRFPPGE